MSKMGKLHHFQMRRLEMIKQVKGIITETEKGFEERKNPSGGYMEEAIISEVMARLGCQKSKAKEYIGVAYRLLEEE